MNEFALPFFEKGDYKMTKVEPFPHVFNTGLVGEKIDGILKEAEEKGYLTLPYKDGFKAYGSLRATFLEYCRKKNLLYVEVYVDDERNRAFACFDTITLDKNQRDLKISEMILSIELQTYYESFSDVDRAYLLLPASMNPYAYSKHQVNFSILPKQICFSFYQDRPEIFNFALRKLRFKK